MTSISGLYISRLILIFGWERGKGMEKVKVKNNFEIILPKIIKDELEQKKTICFECLKNNTILIR